MVEFNDDIDDAVRREANNMARTEIPAGQASEAVASMIEQYKPHTGIELPEAVVLPDVRAQMHGRETTP